MTKEDQIKELESRLRCLEPYSGYYKDSKVTQSDLKIIYEILLDLIK